MRENCSSFQHQKTFCNNIGHMWKSRLLPCTREDRYICSICSVATYRRSFARACAQWEELMNRSTTSMLAGMVIAASPTLATEVTPERLINADREPQNWLMNHRTYDGQRFSP